MHMIRIFPPHVSSHHCFWWLFEILMQRGKSKGKAPVYKSYYHSATSPGPFFSRESRNGSTHDHVWEKEKEWGSSKWVDVAAVLQDVPHREMLARQYWSLLYKKCMKATYVNNCKVQAKYLWSYSQVKVT